MDIPSPRDLDLAAERIAPYAHRTPIHTCRSLDALTGASLYFKCENLQRVGAFKFRGALNTVLGLTDEVAHRGVVTHSSGNHAQALALAARIRGIEAHLVMPSSARRIKVRGVEAFGGRVIHCEPDLASREATATRVQEETGAHFVHPYDDPRIIAGQATATRELIEDVPDLDAILVPVGGGGLASGACLAASVARGSPRVIGVEPAGADDAHRSLAAGHLIPSKDPRTCADGLLTSLSPRTYHVLSTHLDALVTVSEEGIIAAMRLFWERAKLVIEPSSAVVLAALLEEKVDLEGAKVGLILSGGNVDLDDLPW